MEMDILSLFIFYLAPKNQSLILHLAPNSFLEVSILMLGLQNSDFNHYLYRVCILRPYSVFYCAFRPKNNIRQWISPPNFQDGSYSGILALLFDLVWPRFRVCGQNLNVRQGLSIINERTG